jgi:SAM-dependent methyltransferase
VRLRLPRVPLAQMNSDPPTKCFRCGQVLRLALKSHDFQFPVGDEFAVLECTSCGLAETEPRLAGEELAAHYPASYSAFRTSSSRLRAWDRRRRMRREPLRTIARQGTGALLDVGCGAGELASLFIPLGWKVSGLDVSAGAVAAAVQRGVDARTGTLEGAFGGERFTVVLFHHSLEHMPDPLGALREAAAVLDDGGLLVVVAPNWGSPLQRLFRGRWFQLDVPRHLYHFSSSSLKGLAQDADLTVERVTHTDAPESFLGSVQYAVAGKTILPSKLTFLLTLCLAPLGRLLAPRDNVCLYAHR